MREVMERSLSLDELADVAARLHDSPFSLGESTFQDGFWVGVFLRPVWDDPAVRHRGVPLVFVASRVPVVKALVRVSGVSHVEVVDEARIGTYFFNELEWVGAGLELRFEPRLRITLRGERLAVTYAEEALADVWADYRQFFLVQSGPRIVGAGAGW